MVVFSKTKQNSKKKKKGLEFLQIFLMSDLMQDSWILMPNYTLLWLKNMEKILPKIYSPFP